MDRRDAAMSRAEPHYPSSAQRGADQGGRRLESVSVWTRAAPTRAFEPSVTRPHIRASTPWRPGLGAVYGSARSGPGRQHPSPPAAAPVPTLRALTLQETDVPLRRPCRARTTSFLASARFASIFARQYYTAGRPSTARSSPGPSPRKCLQRRSDRGGRPTSGGA